MTQTLYRYEDKDGRGPFKPGFSHRWVSPTRDGPPPPWEEAGIGIGEFQQLFTPGMHGGSACKSKQQLRLWFNFMERRRLAKLGYRMVAFTPDRILLETPTQVVFERAAINTGRTKT